MSGGKKKRSDLRQGQQQFNQFANQAIGTLQPFAQGGQNAFNQGNSLLGLNGLDAQNGANQNFFNSLAYTGGQNAFNTERDAINAGLSDQGLLFSQARINGVEDARQRNFQNAFSQYLGLNQNQAGIGANTAGAIAQTQLGQGQAALGTAQNIANTRQGFLGTLGQISQIGSQIGQAAAGFSDRRLKSDVERIGFTGPLPLYKWRWNDEAKALGLEGPSSGFMADDVAKVIPEAVGERQGYKTVDYRMVLERLAQ